MTNFARVVKFSPEGAYLMAWGARGAAPGRFNVPHGIAIDARGQLYVADRGNARIQVFDGDGRFLEKLDVGRTIFGMIFNDQNELFVVERNAHRVMKVVLK